ncbi:MAG: hypothetical protein Q4E80_01275 [Slackia faecicanis]|nr:hypothetical protein [Slackia faecicanis]
MPTYIAHYKSPNGSTQVSGVFEFESTHRAGSKQNMHDARMCMLQSYGNEAVAWQIDAIEAKKADEARSDHQMQLDFREPAEHKPKKRIVRGFK